MSDQGKNTTHDSAMGWGILLCVFMALFALFWYFFEFKVKSGFRWWRWGEMNVVALFVPADYQVVWNGKIWKFEQWLDGVPLIEPQKLDGQTLDIISALVMVPMKNFFMVCLGLMAAWSFLRGPDTQFRRKLTLDGLIGVQAKTFPIITPFVKFNPSNQPPRPPGAPVPSRLPRFAEALGPEEWLAYHQIPVPDGKIDEQAAFAAFAEQLGPRWEGPMKLPAHKKILLAAFCLKANRKRKECDEMLGRLAKCWSLEQGLQIGRDKKLMSDAMAVLRSKKMAEMVLSNCNQHGFETTAMLRALATARSEGGVLAPAQFVWMRGYDRTLWYPLNNLGRQSFHIEALGAMAHYKAERLTRRPVPKPKVQTAVKTIADYMRSPRARPIPQLDYKGARRGVKQPQSAGVKKPVQAGKPKKKAKR